MKTFEELRQAVEKFEKTKAELSSQMIPYGQSLDSYDESSETHETIVERLQSLHLESLPAEAVAMFPQLLADLTVFNNLVEAQRAASTIHNQAIYDKLQEAHAVLNVETDVPEKALSARIVINKKIVEPDDYSVLIDVYKKLGFTHFQIKANHDYLYYDPNKKHFNTIKELICRKINNQLDDKYPKLVNYFQNEIICYFPRKIDTLIEVMSYRQPDVVEQ